MSLISLFHYVGTISLQEENLKLLFKTKHINKVRYECYSNQSEPTLKQQHIYLQ